MRARKWTRQDLENAAKESFSVRQVLGRLGLRQAGGNYVQIRRIIAELKIDTTHFYGKGWRRGSENPVTPARTLSEILVEQSDYQSFKLKKRLFLEGLKQPACELCGWAKRAPDGRLPLELDHINGIRTDNRIENLRVLCPNCHSLQSTHRGRNIKTK